MVLSFLAFHSFFVLGTYTQGFGKIARARLGIEELMRKMRAESEGVLGARNPTRDAAVNKKAVTETQPSPRSRRKLPPSPALTPTLGKLNLKRKATQTGHTYSLSIL